jgi:polysaccharide deacetylase family protein (PEP-CTERM system associated)
MRPTFVLSCDFEDWHQLVLRRLGRPDWRAGSGEFVEHVGATLALLDELGVTATFFVAGVAAERHPDALRAVARAGHEIACHGYLHRRVFQQTPAEFRADVVRSLDVIEEICGETPAGYRAPWFSINRDARWALDVLAEIGFRYDSSLYDSPRLPRRLRPVPDRPFRLAGGLWEFPLAVARIGRAALPLAGGAYWRLAPTAALRRGLDHVARAQTSPVLYFHAYECASAPLEVRLPARAPARRRLRETTRRVAKNTRRSVIPELLREAASRYRLVPFRDVLPDDADTTVFREARAVA